MDAEEIRKAVHGKALGNWQPGLEIRKVSTDTRTLGEGDIFFALKGARFDGHGFIGEALAKGAAVFVVSDEKKIPATAKKAAAFVQVKDALAAYGDLARAYREKFKIPAIAVTGSSGKTTVKELIAHILSAAKNTLKNRGTENNLVGVPKTILQLRPSHEVLVLEMGTNRPGEIGRLSEIIRPQIAVITQIGLAHLEGLKDPESIRKEKLSVVKHLERGGLLVLNGEDARLKEVQSGVHKILRAGFSPENDLAAEGPWCHEKGSSFRLDGELFETQLIGRHNVINCLLAIGVARALGLDTETVKKALASFKPVAGRLSWREIEGVFFIDDSYNSNPGSFRSALETLKEFKIRERRGVVCGDMLELGKKAEEIHRELGKLMAELLFDFVVAAGPLSKHLADEMLKNGYSPKKVFHAADSAEAGRICRELAQPGDRVLVKGSRGMQMEKVFECFITSSIR